MRGSQALIPTFGVMVSVLFLAGPAGADPHYVEWAEGSCHATGQDRDYPTSRRELSTTWDFYQDPFSAPGVMRICYDKELRLVQRGVGRWNDAATRCPKRYVLAVPGNLSVDPNLDCAANSTLTMSYIIIVENYTNPTSPYNWLSTSGLWTSQVRGTTHVTWDPQYPTKITQAAVYVNSEPLPT